MLLNPAWYLWRAAPGCPPCYPCALEYCPLGCRNLGTKSDFNGLGMGIPPFEGPWTFAQRWGYAGFLMNTRMHMRNWKCCHSMQVYMDTSIYESISICLFLLRHKYMCTLQIFRLNQEPTFKIMWNSMQWNAPTHQSPVGTMLTVTFLEISSANMVSK